MNVSMLVCLLFIASCYGGPTSSIKTAQPEASAGTQAPPNTSQSSSPSLATSPPSKASTNAPINVSAGAPTLAPGTAQGKATIGARPPVVYNVVPKEALTLTSKSSIESSSELLDATPIEVTALGRAAQLGELYDARNDHFLRLQLFNESLPKEVITGTENWHTKLKLSMINTLEEKFNLLDVSASLKVSVMGGLFSLEGSGKFFKDTKKSYKSAKATLIHSITTKYEQINMIASAISQKIDLAALNDIDSTHVVVGIQWGGNAFVSVEDSNQNNDDVQVIEGKLSAELEKLSLKISGDAKVNVTEEERKKYSKFSFEIYGDVLPDKVPQNLVDAVAFMQDVPTRIRNANEGRGKAMSYSLLPISLLRKRFGDASKLMSLVKEVNDATVKKATKLFDDLNTQQAKINDLMRAVNRYEPYIPTSQVKALREIDFKFNVFQSEVQKALAEHLIAVRAGKEEVHHLNNMLTNYTGKFQQSKQNGTIMRDLKPTLQSLKFFLNQNVTLLKKNDRLRQFLREHFDQDVYILFFKLNDQSDANEDVINTFQLMLRNRENYGKALFVAASYELLNESKFPVVVDRQNKTKIRLYRDNTLLSDDFTPGQNITDQTKPELWSLHQIQQILNASRTDLKELIGKHEALSKKADALQEDTGRLSANPIPLHFIYIQLPFQLPPEKLWPQCSFLDVTQKYAGKFFRALGGGSEPWEREQYANSPRLENVKFMDTDDAGNWEARLIPGKWSEAVTSGNRDGRWVSLKFLVRDAEVRPANYGVKIFRNNGCGKLVTSANSTLISTNH